jgi:hypothetical protein
MPAREPPVPRNALPGTAPAIRGLIRQAKEGICRCLMGPAYLDKFYPNRPEKVYARAILPEPILEVRKRRPREAKSGAGCGALFGADRKPQQYQSPYCHGSDSHPSAGLSSALSNRRGEGLFSNSLQGEGVGKNWRSPRLHLKQTHA